MRGVDPSSGHGESIAGDSVVAVVSDMQGSGSMELDASASTQATAETAQAPLPFTSPLSQPVMLEGTLTRKHEMEGPNKRATNR